jgi:hypothetical protein
MCFIYSCNAEEIIEQLQLISDANGGILSILLVSHTTQLFYTEEFMIQISAWRPTFLTEGKTLFSNHSGWDTVIKLGHDHFLPHPLQHH